MCIKTFCEQGLETKAIRARYADKTAAYKHVTEKFELLTKMSTKFDSLLVNIPGATVCSLEKMNFYI